MGSKGKSFWIQYLLESFHTTQIVGQFYDSIIAELIRSTEDVRKMRCAFKDANDYVRAYAILIHVINGKASTIGPR